MDTFASILDKPATEIERPPALPVGHYVAVIQGLPRKDKSTKKQTEYVEYSAKLIQPMDDVDQDAIKEYGSLSDVNFKLTYYITEKSAYRLKEFLLDDLKLELEDGETLWDAAQRANGSQFVVQFKHTPSQDGKGVYHEVASTNAVE